MHTSTCWPVVLEVSSRFTNCNRIFPTMQKDVASIVRYARTDNNINFVIIFGSSVTSLCNNYSDIDVYFDVRDPNWHPTQELYKGITVPLDRWTNYDVDNILYKEILSTGVKVYERQFS